VYNEHGMAQRNGTGMFPREVMNRFPLLPIEEEGQLDDMPPRELVSDWATARPAPRSGHYPEMGRLVAEAGKRDWGEWTAEYGALLMEGLGVMGCERSGRGQTRQRPPAPDGLPEESPPQ